MLFGEDIRMLTSIFERLIVQLLVSMGYGGSVKDAGQAIGRTGDEGIDGIIKEDVLGLEMIYLQAKGGKRFYSWKTRDSNICW
ncbi:restriction endonuclease [Bacillus licheniformis]|nr:restriction endonuclease [Bacillus licheniformis]